MILSSSSIPHRIFDFRRKFIYSQEDSFHWVYSPGAHPILVYLRDEVFAFAPSLDLPVHPVAIEGNVSVYAYRVDMRAHVVLFSNVKLFLTFSQTELLSFRNLDAHN
jgi:hypothetical protein